MNGKKKFLKDMQKGCCGRFMHKRLFCGLKRNNHKYLGGNWPHVYEAPDPSLIQWENLGVSAFSRFIRQVIIYMVCLVIVIICFAAVVYAMDYSKDLKSVSWSESSCGTSLISKDDAYTDYLKPVDDQ